MAGHRRLRRGLRLRAADGEFTFRLTIAGYGVYAVPAATCLHKVKARGFGKLFYQVRNRWYFTLSLYSGRSLVVLAPALLVQELVVILFLARSRVLGAYVRAMARVGAELPTILSKRRAIQRLRRVPDRDVLTAGPINVRPDLMESRSMAAMKRALEAFYSLYWRAAAPLLGRAGARAGRVSPAGPRHPSRITIDNTRGNH